MAVEVVDASALAALLFGEPEGAAVADRLRGANLVAPALLSFEMANICLKKLRRHPAQRQALLTAFAFMARMDIAAVAVDHAEVLDLAERSGRSAYDASIRRPHPGKASGTSGERNRCRSSARRRNGRDRPRRRTRSSPGSWRSPSRTSRCRATSPRRSPPPSPRSRPDARCPAGLGSAVATAESRMTNRDGFKVRD